MSDDKDSVVTKEYLEEYLAQVIQVMEDRTKKQFDSLIAGLSRTIDDKLDPIIAQINKHTNILNAAAQQGPEAPEKKSSLDPITAFINSPLGEQLAPVIKQRLGLNENPDPAVEEFRRNTEKLNSLVYRKAALLTARMLEKGMKSAMKEEFTNIAALDMAKDAVAGHEPL